MTTLSARLIFRAPMAFSLKDKRRIVRSLIEKTRGKFNAAIAEVDTQDVHTVLTFGIAVVSSSRPHAENMLGEIIRYMEDHTDAELVSVERE